MAANLICTNGSMIYYCGWISHLRAPGHCVLKSTFSLAPTLEHTHFLICVGMNVNCFHVANSNTQTLPAVSAPALGVTSAHERLNAVFAGALAEAGFTSWVGEDVSAPTDWLVAKWGDVYLHETVISHIRRLLDTRFTCEHLHETAAQLTERMMKVLLGQFQFLMTCGRND